MKTVFIINPEAGQGDKIEKFISSINTAIKDINADAEIYLTRSVGDATSFVKEYCQKNGIARFIACGGDGTLSEVLNGAIAFDGAEVGVMPRGTGNDFCRNFDNDCEFASIFNQITGETVPCDVIKYTTTLNGKNREGYCVNMSNIGFDCSVADLTSDIKKKPFISGSFAYFLSILFNLIKKNGENLLIELDGKVKHDGRMLMTSIANGCYCGGGIKSNPLALLNDGMINVNIVKNVSRMRLIYLLPFYMKGTFLKLSHIERYITSVKCSKIFIKPKSQLIRLCVDGEITDAGEVTFEIVNNAFKFVLPKEIKKELSLQKQY